MDNLINNNQYEKYLRVLKENPKIEDHIDNKLNLFIKILSVSIFLDGHISLKELYKTKEIIHKLFPSKDNIFKKLVYYKVIETLKNYKNDESLFLKDKKYIEENINDKNIYLKIMKKIIYSDKLNNKEEKFLKKLENNNENFNLNFKNVEELNQLKF